VNFLNLNLVELMSIAGAISAGILALYLLDRSKRRQRVATLRFWSAADVRTELKHRRRIQQPWSLLLQLLSMLFLLIAIAGPRWGGNEGSARDHVLILDTSAWMGSQVPGSQVPGRGSAATRSTLLDQAKASARAYLAALPASDRVMLVRADALATPATRFESNRPVIEEAIRQSQASASALNLAQAFEFAQRAQRLQSHSAGEIVFAGAGRIAEQDAQLIAPPPNLRLLPATQNGENVGLRKIGLRRSPAAPDTWNIFVAVRNYGVRPHTVDLEVQFGGAPAGSQRLSLRPGTEEQATFAYRTRAAGWLEARIRTQGGGDVFPQDDRAVIELPAENRARVVVYTADPESLEPLIASNPQVDAAFQPPANYDPGVKADIVVLDRFAPSARPKSDSIWIEPPSSLSPIPVLGTRSRVKLEQWHQETALGSGLHTKDVQLASAEIFATVAGDIPVADAAGGPVIVARPGSSGGPKIVVIGFQPIRSSMRYELATPLLVANILRWMAPDTFRRYEVQAGSVGIQNVTLEKGVDPSSVRVLNENQRPLPFTMDGTALRFFAGAPGAVRVVAGDRETVYSLTLPELGETVWRPPQNVRRGVPGSFGADSVAIDLWPWFAVFGALGLLVDWLLFGRSRALHIGAAKMKSVFSWQTASTGWKAASSSFKKAPWRKAS